MFGIVSGGLSSLIPIEAAYDFASAASEAQVDVMYGQISQLKVENDFLARNPRT